MRSKITHYILGLLSFAVPFCLYSFTRSTSLGFADAAEFALVTKIASIAHAPGFPSYIFLGWLWGNISIFFTPDHAYALALFSATCTASACLLLYLLFRKVGLYQYKNTLSENLISAGSAITVLAFATGMTVWFWSNCVEVYALHMLAMAMVLYGLGSYNLNGKIMHVVIAAVGLGIGVANHHLTMIFFIPFLILLLDRQSGFMNAPVELNKKKVSNLPGFWNRIFKLLFQKEFKVLVGVSLTVSVLFYGWMYVRAGVELPYKFGQPDNLDRLIYHLAGGAWIKQTQKSVEGLAALRLPYFAQITFRQFFIFIPFLVMGIIHLFRLKKRSLLGISLLFFFLIFMYQLRIDQTSDTDAYMLLPFMALCIPLAYGIWQTILKARSLVFIFPVLIFAQAAYSFPRVDKRDYLVSESLMQELDKSSPQGSTLLIADWTLVIQYYYYRIVHNFRPDLVVLNYDLKFTHYKILPNLFPEYYAKVKPEYDDFIAKLGKEHPQEIYNTGGTLNTQELMNAYSLVIRKMRDLAVESGHPFMADPKAYVFLVNQKVIPDKLNLSGFFVSNIPVDSDSGFVNRRQKWLDSPILLHDPAASDKVVDLQAAYDFHKRYFEATGDAQNLLAAQNNLNFILQKQKEMKKNMPFIYRPK